MMGVPYRNRRNTAMSIVLALGTTERPITFDEFREFWDSLTKAEQDFYLNANLS